MAPNWAGLNLTSARSPPVTTSTTDLPSSQHRCSTQYPGMSDLYVVAVLRWRGGAPRREPTGMRRP